MATTESNLNRVNDHSEETRMHLRYAFIRCGVAGECGGVMQILGWFKAQAAQNSKACIVYTGMGMALPSIHRQD
ncbi:MAG: hypothetical protein ACKOPT_09850 [Cyanobium sp.]